MLKKFVLAVLFVMNFLGLSMAEDAVGKDYGKQPWVVNIEDLTVKNENFRATKWTGRKLSDDRHVA